MAAKPIPDGYHTVTPYLVVRGAAKTIEFLKKAFGAESLGEPMRRPDGLIMHTEVKIGNSRVMISDATEQHPAMPTMLYLYVPDVDAVFKRRPFRRRERPCRQSLVHRHAQGRRGAAGTQKTRRSASQGPAGQGSVAIAPQICSWTGIGRKAGARRTSWRPI